MANQIHMRVLLMAALSLSAQLAQSVEPDRQNHLSRLIRADMSVTTTATATPTPTAATTTTTAAKPQQRAQTTTTTRPQVASSSLASQVTTTTTSTQVPTTNSQYQYMKPMTTTTTTTAPVVAPQAKQASCQYNNQTYALGQSWNDDCEQVCVCVASESADAPTGVSACRERCPKYKDLLPGCRLERSRFDSCCLDYVCGGGGGDSEPKQVTTTVINTEQGQINVTTTDIRLPSSTVSMQTAASPAAVVVTTTTTPTTTTGGAPPTTTTRQPAPNRVITTTTTQARQTTQVPTTTVASQPKVVTTTTTAAGAVAQPTLKPFVRQQQQQQQQSPPQVNTRSPKAIVDSASTRQLADSALLTTQQPQTVTAARNKQPLPVMTTTTTTTTTTTPESAHEEEVKPELYDLCIWVASDPRNKLERPQEVAYRLNDSWLQEPCQQSCRCAFRSEPRDPTADIRIVKTLNMKPDSAQTEIRCGLPPTCGQVAMRLVAAPDCPAPRLMMPQESLDACACPRVECQRRPTSALPVAATTTTTTTTTTEATLPEAEPAGEGESAPTSSVAAAAAGCQAKSGGRLLAVGETYKDECHATCRCDEELKISCQQLECPPEPEVSQECARWVPEPNFRSNSSSDRCCPQYVCAAAAASQQQQPTVVEPTPAGCSILGKEVAHGQQVPELMQPRTGEPDCAKACYCDAGKIVCQPMCPPLSELPPEDLPCPAQQAYKATEECCPKWECSIMEEYAFHTFDVTPLNATSVEVNFTLPRFAVGQHGQAELNYTGLPASQASAGSTSDLPPASAHWIRKAHIRTHDGVFFSRVVKYHLNNLKPAHKYWFKLVVRFQGTAAAPLEGPLEEPLESPLQRVVMPPLPQVEEDDDILASTVQVPTTTTTRAPRTTKLYPVMTSPSNLPASRQPSATTTTTTSTTTTTTTTTTTEPPNTDNSSEQQPSPTMGSGRPQVEAETPMMKPDVASYNTPCSQNNNGAAGKTVTGNDIDGASDQLSLPWGVDSIPYQIPIHRKSSCAIASITPPSAYDNPSFTKLQSYNPQTLLLDETSNQNYTNAVRVAEEKNRELDKDSPFNQHRHQMNDFSHHNTRLI